MVRKENFIKLVDRWIGREGPRVPSLRAYFQTYLEMMQIDPSKINGHFESRLLDKIFEAKN